MDVVLYWCFLHLTFHFEIFVTNIILVYKYHCEIQTYLQMFAVC